MPLIRKGGAQTPGREAPGDAFVALKTGDTDARWAAARSLAGESGGVAALAAALTMETDARVREAILTALARAATPEAVEAILPSVRSNDAGLRTGALDALRTIPDLLEPRLGELLADPDPDVRLLSCELARALPAATAAPMLSALLDRDPQVNVCAAAVEVLAEIGGPDALPALERCAARFPGEPFLAFAIKIAAGRLGEL